MEYDLQWLLLGLPIAFALGWLGSRLDLRQLKREQRDSPRAYFKGLNLLLNEQPDKAIDAFIEAVQHDPDTSDLHFALGSLFRRRGEFERAVRVHQHLLSRGDLSAAERERAQHALAQDFMKAGLFDRAEEAFGALEGTAFESDARLALLTLYERARDWHRAADIAAKLEASGSGSFAQRIAHHWCEIALDADTAGRPDDAEAALQRAREVAPNAARTVVLVLERALRRGQPQRAFEAGVELLRRDGAAAYLLVAQDHARAALACGRADEARARVETLYASEPSLDLLRALMILESPGAARARVERHLAKHPSLGAAAALLASDLPEPASELAGDSPVAKLRVLPQGLRDAVERAARPLARYRCAACGFEAQRHFWQCPGCSGWDTFPPRRIEEL